MSTTDRLFQTRLDAASEAAAIITINGFYRTGPKESGWYDPAVTAAIETVALEIVNHVTDPHVFWTAVLEYTTINIEDDTCSECSERRAACHCPDAA